MAEYRIKDETLTSVADAIRAKKGTTDGIAAEDFATEIEALQVGDADIALQEKTVTANGEVTPDTGYDGLSKVTVNVPNTGDEETEKALRQTIDRTITTAVIPDGTTEIAQYAFCACYYLTKAVVPSGVTALRNYAFNGCTRLHALTLPDSITIMTNNSVAQCSTLPYVNIPTALRELGDSAFDGCYILDGITLPEGLTKIGNNVFRNCRGLTQITIPSSVTSIGTGVFMNCTSLREVTFHHVFNIQGGIFDRCSALELWDFSEVEDDTIPTLDATAAQMDTWSKLNILVPVNWMRPIKAASNWSYMKDRIICIEEGRYPATTETRAEVRWLTEGATNTHMTLYVDGVEYERIDDLEYGSTILPQCIGIKYDDGYSTGAIKLFNDTTSETIIIDNETDVIVPLGYWSLSVVKNDDGTIVDTGVINLYDDIFVENEDVFEATFALNGLLTTGETYACEIDFVSLDGETTESGTHDFVFDGSKFKPSLGHDWDLTVYADRLVLSYSVDTGPDSNIRVIIRKNDAITIDCEWLGLVEADTEVQLMCLPDTLSGSVEGLNDVDASIKMDMSETTHRVHINRTEDDGSYINIYLDADEAAQQLVTDYDDWGTVTLTINVAGDESE